MTLPKDNKERQKLNKIYRLVHRKLIEIQVEDRFTKALENWKNLTYIEKSDNYFFQRMVDVVFQSGIRGVIWQRFEPEIRKECARGIRTMGLSLDYLRTAFILQISNVVKFRKA